MWAIGWRYQPALLWGGLSLHHLISQKKISSFFFLSFNFTSLLLIGWRDSPPFVWKSTFVSSKNLRQLLARCIEDSLSLDYPSGSPFPRWVRILISKRFRTHGTYVFYIAVPSRQPCNLNIFLFLKMPTPTSYARSTVLALLEGLIAIWRCKLNANHPRDADCLYNNLVFHSLAVPCSSFCYRLRIGQTSIAMPCYSLTLIEFCDICLRTG